MHLRHLVSYLLLLVLTATPLALNAQTPQRAAKVQFSCVSWKKLPFEELLYRDGKKFLPLELMPKNRSKLYPSRQSRMFELFISETDDNDKQSFKLVGRAPFPASANRVLFLISEKKKSKGLPLTIYGVDDSLTTFPPGSFRFVNSTRIPLQVVIGKKTKPIAPKAMTVVKLNVSAKGGFIPFFVKSSKDVIVYENRLYGTTSARDMIFIGPPPFPGGRVTVVLLPQIIAPTLPKPTNN